MIFNKFTAIPRYNLLNPFSKQILDIDFSFSENMKNELMKQVNKNDIINFNIKSSITDYQCSDDKFSPSSISLFSIPLQFGYSSFGVRNETSFIFPQGILSKPIGYDYTFNDYSKEVEIEYTAFDLNSNLATVQFDFNLIIEIDGKEEYKETRKISFQVSKLNTSSPSIISNLFPSITPIQEEEKDDKAEREIRESKKVELVQKIESYETEKKTILENEREKKKQEILAQETENKLTKNKYIVIGISVIVLILIIYFIRKGK